MALPLAKESPPLRSDEHGVVRVGDSRLTLDLVVGAFLEGATAAEQTRHEMAEVVGADALRAKLLARHQG